MGKPDTVIRLRKNIENKISPIINKLNQYGVKANHLTFAQLPFNFLMVYFFIIENILAVSMSLIIILALDVLDGMFARITKTFSKKGHFYDKIFDLISITAFIIGFIIYAPNYELLLIIILIQSYIIYILNEFTKVETVGCVRSVGLLGLILNLKLLSLYVILIVSGLGIFFKIFQFTSGRRKGD